MAGASPRRTRPPEEPRPLAEPSPIETIEDIAPMPAKTSEAPDPVRLRLMIVDDGSLVTPPLTRALTQAGFRIELVADPDYALSDTRGQTYDAIIINSDYADVDALWLCQALRIQGFLSVIVVLTDAPSETDQLAAWRAGANDRVGRSIPRERLVERILAQIDGARIKVTGLLYPVTAELPTSAGVITMSLVPTLVTLDKRPVTFTRIEERLLARLWSARGAVVPVSELIASAWLDRQVLPPTFQSHLYQLRRKLRKLGLNVERVGARGYTVSSFLPSNGGKNRGAPQRRH
jgi:DNA-binding response OmpR family regulator